MPFKDDKTKDAENTDFEAGSNNTPMAIRIIDPAFKKEIAYFRCEDYGTNIEPEFIDFDGNECYYIDHNGNAHKLIF